MGDLEFSMSVYNNAGKDIDLTALRMELQYDFVERNPQLRLCDIQLQVATAEPPDGTPKSKGTYMPYFVVGKADKNQRSDAHGWVHRIYDINALGRVDIRAQSRYGDWKFNKWTNQYGQDLPGGPWLDPLLEIVPDMDKAFAAQYVPLDVLPADLNSDCVVDMADLATMAAAWLNVFPMISLNGEDAMLPIGMPELITMAQQWGMTYEEAMQGTTTLKAMAMRRTRGKLSSANSRGVPPVACAGPYGCACWIFAQVSRRPTVRLKISRPCACASGSVQK